MSLEFRRDDQNNIGSKRNILYLLCVDDFKAVDLERIAKRVSR